MSTKHADLFAALGAPFAPVEVKTRNQAGRQLKYISARVAMNRLDEVLGPENWQDEYTETRLGLKCRINFRLPGSDEWLFKEDGGAAAGMSEADNNEKSAYSDAFKRAAVKLGVGRYLYNDGVADHGETDSPPRRERDHAPRADSPAERQRSSSASASNGHAGDDNRPPKSGRALFAICKKIQLEDDFDAPAFVNAWGKRQDGLSFKMVDWPERAVVDAHAALMAELKPAGAPASSSRSSKSSALPGEDDDDIPF